MLNKMLQSFSRSRTLQQFLSTMRQQAVELIASEYTPRQPIHEFALQCLANSQDWICRELVATRSQFRPALTPDRNFSKTFELADFSIPKVKDFAKSILDFISPINYHTFPYQTRLGPIMNGQVYIKIWEVAYLAAVSNLRKGDRVLIAASGPSYWIPIWHKEILGCDVTCFDKNQSYNKFTIDDSIYDQYGIAFSYQDAGDFHYDEVFDAILSHCSLEHFFGGTARRFIMRAGHYLVDGGVFGCATQIWNPGCKFIGQEVPEWGYIFFSSEIINDLMSANPSFVSLDGKPFVDYQDWSRYNFFEVDYGRYMFDEEECLTLCSAFSLKKAKRD